MREILFRGKCIEDGEWVEGFYCPVCLGSFPCSPSIIPKVELNKGCWQPVPIVIKTLSQYTGLTDKNGKKIFEGDIFKPFDDEIIVVSWIEYFSHLGLMVYTTIKEKKRGKENVYISSGWSFLFDYDLNEREIIGNIHDNPELLKVGVDNAE